MSLPQPLLTSDDYLTGMTWDQYITQVSASARMQLKQYQSITTNELSAFVMPDQQLRALILTMERCGDGAWAVPRLVRILQDKLGIETRIFFRNEREDLMDLLETNGKRAVPKLAILDEGYRIVGTWGPYPEAIKPYVRKHAGLHDRSEWYPEVLQYYHESGHTDMIQDVHTLLTSLTV